MPILEILKGAQAGRRCELNGKEIVVGRLAECDIVLPDDTVSRRHARFFRDQEDWYVEDLQSRNGTFVNGERIGRATQLQHSDCVMLHDLPLRFQESPRNDEPRSNGNEFGDEYPSSQSRMFDSPVTFETVAEVDIRDALSASSRVRPETKLQAVLEITRELRGSLELEQVLPRILETVFRVFPQADRGYILQSAPGDETRLIPAALKDRNESAIAATLRPITRAIAQQVMSSGKAILSGEPGSSSANDDDDESSIFEMPMRSIMSAPLLGPSRNPTGIIWVDTSDREHPFDREDLDLLACVGILAGQAVEYASREQVRYQAVVNTAADGIITTNDRGVIESLNPAVERLFGYSRAELLGREVDQLMPPAGSETQSVWLSRTRDPAGARSGGDGTEIVGRRKDGSTFPLSLSVGEFELDGRRCYTGIVQDVTRRKEAEDALRRLNETLEQRVEQRTRDVRLLQDVAVIANEAETVEQAYAETLERMRRYMQWTAGRVFIPSGRTDDDFIDSGIHAQDSASSAAVPRTSAPRQISAPTSRLVEQVIEKRTALWIADASRNSDIAADPHAADSDFGLLANGARAIAAFPVLLGDRLVAVFEFYSAEPQPVDDALRELMSHVGTQLSRVVERRELQIELIDAVWGQQRQFGQELHDCLGQELTGIRMMAESLKWRLQSRSAPEATFAEEIIELIREAHQGVRQLAKGLFPVEVFAHGLMSALEELAERISHKGDVDCRFDCSEPVDVKSNSTATHLFRIAQEATNNAVNHGRARRIRISLSARDEQVELRIADDGLGIDNTSSDRPEGMGLRIMRYRASVVGATLSVEPGPDGGTVVTCLVEPRQES